jgi:hypothetical protein
MKLTLEKRRPILSGPTNMPNKLNTQKDKNHFQLLCQALRAQKRRKRKVWSSNLKLRSVQSVLVHQSLMLGQMIPISLNQNLRCQSNQEYIMRSTIWIKRSTCPRKKKNMNKQVLKRYSASGKNNMEKYSRSWKLVLGLNRTIKVQCVNNKCLRIL